MGFLTVLIIALVAIAIFKGIHTSIKRKTMQDHVALIKNFSATQKVMGADGNTGLAIDEQRNTVCLMEYRSQIMSTRVVPCKDLLSSELFEDGTTITKTVRSSQIGGLLIGGLALGGIGAIIGGLSGKTQSSQKIKNIALRLTVNDTERPLHDVSFLTRETKRGNGLYRQAMQHARHWHALLEVLIKRADTDDKASVSNRTSQIQSSSIADEVKKLADLRDSGVLSIDEFQQQKSRLFGA